MDLRQLRYFVAVAEAGHMTRAAAQLGIQQPPLSLQIKALETRLGMPLFHRHPKGVALSDGGRLFLVEARRILQDMEALEQRMGRIARGQQGPLSIGFTSSAAAHAFTPEALRACRSRFPEIELIISENNAAEITEAIASARLHAGFLRVPVSRPEGVALETMLNEPAMVALPLDHRLAQSNDAIGVKDLHGENFILVRQPGAPGLYANLLSLCAANDVTLKVVAEVSRMMTNINLIAAGVGISVVPASMQGAHPHAIVYRPLAASARLDAPLTLAYRAADCTGPTATFVALVREIAAAHKARDADNARRANKAQDVKRSAAEHDAVVMESVPAGNVETKERGDGKARFRGLTRRAALLCLCGSPVVPAWAQAQAQAALPWPTRALRIMVAYPPGGVSDEITRALAEKLTAQLGVPVLVENRGGAGGSVAMDALAKSAPDGYTLCFSAITPLTLLPYLGPVNYDPARDIVPVASVMFTPVLVVGTSALEGRSMAEMIAAARARPGSMRWATTGLGTTGHMVLEQVRKASNTDITHIPYKGGGQQITDALSGQFELLSTNVGAMQLQHIRTGKFKPLAVGALNRLAVLPDVPTFAELGFPQANLVSLFGLFAPGGTPPGIVQRLNAEVNKALALPEIRQRLRAVNNVPAGGSVANFARHIAQDLERNRVEMKRD